MLMFKDILADSESLFKNDVALDFSFVPKLVPYREKEQRLFAACIKPLFQDRNGRNILVFGQPGVGKTVALKHVLNELEEETDSIISLYINCWQKNTTFKILMEICDQIDYKFTHNKKSDELMRIIAHNLNKKAAVFVFDEIDKAEDFDFLYFILEEIYNKSIFLITNYKEKVFEMDERIRSRLTPEILEFKQYNETETKGILKQRLGYAFHENVWDDDAFETAVKKTFEMKDIRAGLYILKEAGLAAEDKASRKIDNDHVKTALKKLDEFYIKKSTDLEDETKFILGIAKKNPNIKIGNLFKLYQKGGGKLTYKTFQRKVRVLEDNKFITAKKIIGGTEGTTTIINPVDKDLSDY